MILNSYPFRKMLCPTIAASALRRREKKSCETIADGSQAAPSAFGRNWFPGTAAPEHREEVPGDNFANHAVGAIADDPRMYPNLSNAIPVKTCRCSRSPEEQSPEDRSLCLFRARGLAAGRSASGFTWAAMRSRRASKDRRQRRCERHKHRDGGCRRTAAHGPDAKAGSAPLLAASRPPALVHGCEPVKVDGLRRIGRSVVEYGRPRDEVTFAIKQPGALPASRASPAEAGCCIRSIVLRTC